MKIFQKEKKIFIPRRLSLYLLSFNKLKCDKYYNKLMNQVKEKKPLLFNSKYGVSPKKFVLFDTFAFEKMLKNQSFKFFVPEYNLKVELQEIVNYLRKILSVKVDYGEQLYSFNFNSSSIESIKEILNKVTELTLQITFTPNFIFEIKKNQIKINFGEKKNEIHFINLSFFHSIFIDQLPKIVLFKYPTRRSKSCLKQKNNDKIGKIKYIYILLLIILFNIGLISSLFFIKGNILRKIFVFVFFIKFLPTKKKILKGRYNSR